MFATSAITALTAQNTLGVTGIMDVTPEFLGEQLDAVFTDIYPDAVKIGMVSSSSLIEMIAKSSIRTRTSALRCTSSVRSRHFLPSGMRRSFPQRNGASPRPSRPSSSVFPPSL